MTYARIVDGQVVETREFTRAPDPNPAKGLMWLPVEEEAKPLAGEGKAVDDGGFAVVEGKVTQRWVLRDLTAEEIAEREREIRENSVNLVELEARVKALEDAMTGGVKGIR